MGTRDGGGGRENKRVREGSQTVHEEGRSLDLCPLSGVSWWQALGGQPILLSGGFSSEVLGSSPGGGVCPGAAGGFSSSTSTHQFMPCNEPLFPFGGKENISIPRKSH